MSHTPTTERVSRADSPDRPLARQDGASSLRDFPETQAAGESDSFTEGLPDLDGEDFAVDVGAERSGLEGVRRADITPPSNPLGCESRDADDLDLVPVEANDADPSDMIKTHRPASSPIADYVSSSFDHSEAEDIILCQPPAAHLAMLSIRLPARVARRSIPSFNKPAADCAADQAFRPLIPLGKPGENGDLIEVAALDGQATTASSSETEPASDGAVITAATRSAMQMPELPPRGEIARLGVRRPGAAPRRIGSGALVPAKLTWMPKDPFGNGIRKQPTSRFRWELMLTAACITAGIGLACVWLFGLIRMPA